MTFLSSRVPSGPHQQAAAQERQPQGHAAVLCSPRGANAAAPASQHRRDACAVNVLRIPIIRSVPRLEFRLVSVGLALTDAATPLPDVAF